MPRVYLLDIETGIQEVVGSFPGMTFAPRFSPDGKKIIMSFAKDGNSDIYTMDLKTRIVEKSKGALTKIIPWIVPIEGSWMYEIIVPIKKFKAITKNSNSNILIELGLKSVFISISTILIISIQSQCCIFV